MGDLHQTPSGKPWVKLAGFAAVAALVMAGLSLPLRAADKAEKAVDFNGDIKPILSQACFKCHSPNPRNPRGPSGGLRLDDKAAAMKGGKTGVAIVVGKSADSLLVKVLSGPSKVGDHEVSAMPKAMRGQEFKPLAQDKIDLIKLWIDQGAKW
jgi:hypothetical protein